MKTLILNGSPRKDGNTVQCIEVLEKYLKGEIMRLNPFHNKLAPCQDCRACFGKPVCIIKDDMDLIYADDYGILVLASPLHMSSLPGPLVNLLSRLQVYYASRKEGNTSIKRRHKKAALILLGGGEGLPDIAIQQAKTILRILRAKLSDEDIVMSLNTDRLPVKEDKKAMDQIKEMAFRLNEFL